MTTSSDIDATGLGIAVYGFNRPDLLENTLESLKRQGAIGNVHIWLDGHQGSPHLKVAVEEVGRVATSFGVAEVHRHHGNIGMRKMILHSLFFMSDRYKRLILLEDDCFPSSNCIEQFHLELNGIEQDQSIFSVYGHHFNLPGEKKDFTRFQGWGWATTSDRLAPRLVELLRCFLMTEKQFLAFTDAALTPAILKRIDVTPGRQPSTTLRKFFAWDETLCLLTALKNLKHRRSHERIVYNCGAGENSAHFTNIDHYRKPPFNMISSSEVWDVF